MRLSLLFLTLLFAPAWGAQQTLLIYDVGTKQTHREEGNTSIYLSPYCSFNIALSLIGFDSGILEDTENPGWQFEERFEEEYLESNNTFPDTWRGLHTPRTWMQNSVVWFSQEVTRRLGMSRFVDYVKAFHYGNQNLTGDAGKGNGLTYAWIGSSLRISVAEQVFFLCKLIKETLPVSRHAFACTKEILFNEELPNGMKLYGKTGSGSYGNGKERASLRVGWFVGWAEKDGHTLAFASQIKGTDPEEDIGGAAARAYVVKELMHFTPPSK